MKNDRWRFGVAFAAFMISAASASHFWALDRHGVAFGSLVAGVVVFAALLRWKGGAREEDE